MGTGIPIATLKSRLSRARTALDSAQGELRQAGERVKQMEAAVGEAERNLEQALGGGVSAAKEGWPGE
jgi:hypothetical protein